MHFPLQNQQPVVSIFIGNFEFGVDTNIKIWTLLYFTRYPVNDQLRQLNGPRNNAIKAHGILDDLPPSIAHVLAAGDRCNADHGSGHSPCDAT
jgi:hypothetical protein